MQFRSWFRGIKGGLAKVHDWKSAAFGAYAFYLKLNKPILEHTKIGHTTPTNVVLSTALFADQRNDYEVINAVYNLLDGLEELARASLLATLEWLWKLWNHTSESDADPFLAIVLQNFGPAILPDNPDASPILKFLIMEISGRNGVKKHNFRIFLLIRKFVQQIGDRPIPRTALELHMEEVDTEDMVDMKFDLSQLEPHGLVLQIQKALSSIELFGGNDYKYLLREAVKQHALARTGKEPQKLFDEGKKIALETFKNLRPFHRAVLRQLGELANKIVGSKDGDADVSGSAADLVVTDATSELILEITTALFNQKDRVLILPFFRFMIVAPTDFPDKIYQP